MSYEEEITQLKNKILVYEKMLLEASVPIISSIVENTILVPITGHTTHERFDLIRTRVLNYIGEYRDTSCAVFDFTGVISIESMKVDYNVIVQEIGQLNASLKLMGIRPIYVGFNPFFVRELVSAGIHINIETYVNFKTSLAVLIKEGERALHSV